MWPSLTVFGWISPFYGLKIAGSGKRNFRFYKECRLNVDSGSLASISYSSQSLQDSSKKFKDNSDNSKSTENKISTKIYNPPLEIIHPRTSEAKLLREAYRESLHHWRRITVKWATEQQVLADKRITERKKEWEKEKLERKNVRRKIRTAHAGEKMRLQEIELEQRKRQKMIRAAWHEKKQSVWKEVRREFLAALSEDCDLWIRSPNELSYRRYDLSRCSSLAGPVNTKEQKLAYWIQHNRHPSSARIRIENRNHRH